MARTVPHRALQQEAPARSHAPNSLPLKRRISTLAAVADEHLKPIIQMAVETGMRAAELLRLMWSQADFDRREVSLEDTKSKQPRIVPLSDRAVAVLVAIRHYQHGPFVFTNPGTGEALSKHQESVPLSLPTSRHPGLPVPLLVAYLRELGSPKRYGPLSPSRILGTPRTR